MEKSRLKCEQSDKILLICFQRDPSETIPEWEEIAATAMAVQNIYLSCSAAHIGCYWSTPKAKNFMHEFCPQSPGEKCLGLFYMGYFEKGKSFPKSPRTPILGKVEWHE
jgi:nitroreductase